MQVVWQPSRLVAGALLGVGGGSMLDLSLISGEMELSCSI